jgi:hypothetical protein
MIHLIALLDLALLRDLVSATLELLEGIVGSVTKAQ